MIKADLQHYEQEKLSYHPVFAKAIDYLKNTDLSDMPVGKVELDGDRMFLAVSEYMTKPRSEVDFENHARYIDIQYIISGSEVIECARMQDHMIPYSDQFADKDIAFYRQVPNGQDVTLRAGDFVVLMPADLHRPCVCLEQPALVKKAVIKIDKDLIIT